MSMNANAESVERFRCAKCRNTTAIVRKVALSKGISPELLSGGGGKYRFLTCALCGYTEVYDLSVYAKKPAEEIVNNESPDLAPET